VKEDGEADESSFRESPAQPWKYELPSSCFYEGLLLWRAEVEGSHRLTFLGNSYLGCDAQ
jgi:hypothetical protein